MSMLNEQKAQHLDDKIVKRNESNSSVLDSIGYEHDAVRNAANDTNDEVTFDKPPTLCNECHGQGKVRGLFHVLECFQCCGTGYDMTDPIYVIKYLQLCQKWAKDCIKKQRIHIDELTQLPKEIREAQAIERFYSKAKRLD